MPRLGDVIAALLSDVALARVQADLEMARVADVYRRDPLLQHLPVPRFRLPELVVDLPVLVTDAGREAVREAAHPAGPSAEELRDAVQYALGNAQIEVSPEQFAQIIRHAERQLARLLEGEQRLLLSSDRLSADLAAAVADTVGKELGADDAERLDPLRASFEKRMRTVLASKASQALAVNVSVAAGAIKAHGDAESTVRLRLTVAEDAYEVVLADDGIGYSLSPE